MNSNFVITMLDGEKVSICDDTLLVGYGDISNIDEPNGMFYSKQLYINTLNGELGTSALATSSPLVGVIGFLSKCTFFSLGDNIDDAEICIYKTSAVKSIGFT
ncbi:TPA_asm: hypothetical protein GYZ54_14415 [Listeria monocytogenes]|nr:hypothetical protein [Listeria monocytogenes]